MSYNFDKETCDDCGVKDSKSNVMDESFRLGFNGSVRCAKCHREHELKSLFDMMDKKDKK